MNNPELLKFARLVDRYLHAKKDYARTMTAGAKKDFESLEKRVEEALRGVFDEKQRQFEFD